MPFLNSVTLMGHLTSDPEVRHLPSGDAVATFTLGVNSGRGEGKPRKGEFFTCDIWGGWAENLAKTAHKGSLVIVEGRLAQDRWVDSKTNQSRSKVKVRASRAFHVAAQYGDPRSEGASDRSAEAEGDVGPRRGYVRDDDEDAEPAEPEEPPEPVEPREAELSVPPSRSRGGPK